jgi:hypothetical protein
MKLNATTRRSLLQVSFRPNSHHVAQLDSIWALTGTPYKWPYSAFQLFDRDSKFGADVVSAVREIKSQPPALPFAVRICGLNLRPVPERQLDWHVPSD